MGDSNECISCHKPTPADGRFMTCSECYCSFHLGQGCSGIAPNTFNAMSDTKRDVWKCKTCRPGSRRGNLSSQTDNTQFDASVSSQLSAIQAQLKALPDISSKVEALISQTKDLLPLAAEVANLNKTISELQDTVSFVSKQYDTVMEGLKSGETALKACETEVAALKATVAAQASQLASLHANMGESEQQCRRANMEVCGLPVVENEDLTGRLSEIAAKLDLQGFRHSDIESIHRLPAKQNTIPKILVKFNDVAIRERWFAARKKLRALSENDALPKMFFNENLTQAKRELFWLAKGKAREVNFKFVWTKDGRILVKKSEGTTVIHIARKSDLDKIK
ncbi:unnamed protein product [Ixodes persulcatus]